MEANAKFASPKKWEFLSTLYSSKPCFQPSVYLNPLYNFSVFDYGYVFSAITAFKGIKAHVFRAKMSSLIENAPVPYQLLKKDPTDRLTRKLSEKAANP